MAEASNRGMDARALAGGAEQIQAWRQRLVRGVLRALAMVGPVVLLFGIYYAYLTHDSWLIPVYLGAYAVIVVLALWRRLPYRVQVWALLVVLFGWGVLGLADAGMSGEGRTILLGVVVLATLLLGLREGVVALFLSFIALAAFAWAYHAGWIPLDPDPRLLATDLTWWTHSGVIFTLLGIVLVLSANYLIPRLVAAATQSQGLALELQEQRGRLEDEVALRTKALARRSTQLEAAAQVAREATATLNLMDLLMRVVTLVSERFGFYHTGIFLLDEGHEWAVLRAASSEGGRRMLARGHRLRVGREGIVGFVTRQGRPRVALDVGADAVFFDNPDLPETRSEVALPLHARGEIIGALDVQSREPAAFDADDVALLQTLADQVALAISNARLFEQVQESVEAERRAYGRLSREGWSRMVQAGMRPGYRILGGKVVPIVESQPSTGVAAADRTSPGLALPVTVRGQTIGLVDVRKRVGAEEWTAEEVALLKTLSEQLGVALESARLYQDAQRTASRERLVGEVTARMRETLDVDTVLQTAAREIYGKLDLAEAEVWLGGDGEEEESGVGDT